MSWKILPLRLPSALRDGAYALIGALFLLMTGVWGYVRWQGGAAPTPGCVALSTGAVLAGLAAAQFAGWIEFVDMPAEPERPARRPWIFRLRGPFAWISSVALFAALLFAEFAPDLIDIGAGEGEHGLSIHGIEGPAVQLLGRTWGLVELLVIAALLLWLGSYGLRLLRAVRSLN